MIWPPVPEEVRLQQQQFLDYEDEYFQMREVDPVNGEYSDQALQVLEKMLKVSPIKFHPNLMKANWLLHHHKFREAKMQFKATLHTVDCPDDAPDIVNAYSLICENIIQGNFGPAIQTLTLLVNEHHPLQRVAGQLFDYLSEKKSEL